jgi:hypothetical protein
MSGNFIKSYVGKFGKQMPYSEFVYGNNFIASYDLPGGYYNKFKCIFNPNTHIDIIEQLKNIETQLLIKSEIRNKIPQYKINEQLKNGIIKIFYELENKPNTSFILKISGIWETQYNYGLTYKFIAVQNP